MAAEAFERLIDITMPRLGGTGCMFIVSGVVSMAMEKINEEPRTPYWCCSLKMASTKTPFLDTLERFRTSMAFFDCSCLGAFSNTETDDFRGTKNNASRLRYPRAADTRMVKATKPGLGNLNLAICTSKLTRFLPSCVNKVPRRPAEAIVVDASS